MVDNETYIWNELIKAGYSEIQTAGIMGNLMRESGLLPNNLQNTYNKAFGLTDEEYTTKVNSGEISCQQFYSDHAGYGLVQWTYWSRKKAMYAKCWPDIGSLTKQTAYMIAELAGFPTVQSRLPLAKTIREASDIIMKLYEMPGNQSETEAKIRAGYGEDIYKRHHVAPAPIKWYGCQVAAYKTEAAAIRDFNKLPSGYHLYKIGTWYKVAYGEFLSEAQAIKNLDVARKQNQGAFVALYNAADLIK